jgi:zinc/manganese transport system substrate-binding protein
MILAFLISYFLISKEIQIVTSTCSLGDIAKNVGGEKVKVINLSDGRFDLHFVEPRPSMLMHIRRADAVIPVGLGFDSWFISLINSAGNRKVIEGQKGYIVAYEGIKLLEVPEFKIGEARIGDIHPEGNPHYWLSPENAIKIAHNIAKRLKEISPENGDYFFENARKFEERINELANNIKKDFSKYEGIEAIGYHKSWQYLAEFLGMKMVEHIEPYPGIPPTSAHLTKLISIIKERNIKLLLYEPFRPKREIKMLEEKTGIKGVEIYEDCVPEIQELKDYESLIKYNVSKIIYALEGK